MFIDIMSKDSYLLVNKKMVKHFGLELSTYFAVLLDVYPQVLKKKLDTLMQTGYFTLQRDYVERECGIPVAQQLALDQALIRLGVIQVNPDNPNEIAISVPQMAEYLLEDDMKVLEKLQKKAKTKKTDEAAGKRAGKISVFSGYAATLTHEPAVQEAYKLWITALVEGGKCAFSKTTVQMFHEAMTKFTQDPQQQVEILRQAAASGYSNADWVINSMKTQKRATSSVTKAPGTWVNAPQKQFTGVSEETF
jgi:hypothetical protein